MSSHILSVNYSWHEINMRAQRSPYRHFIGSRPSQSHFDLYIVRRWRCERLATDCFMPWKFSSEIAVVSGGTLSNTDSVYPGCVLPRVITVPIRLLSSFRRFRILVKKPTIQVLKLFNNYITRPPNKKCSVAFIWRITPIRDLNLYFSQFTKTNIITCIVYLICSIFQKSWRIYSLLFSFKENKKKLTDSGIGHGMTVNNFCF